MQSRPQFPPELWLNIFSFFQKHHLPGVKLVSREFYGYATDDALKFTQPDVTRPSIPNIVSRAFGPEHRTDPQHLITCITATPDGNFLCGFRSGRVVLISGRTGLPVKDVFTARTNKPIKHVVFLDDKTLAVSVMNDWVAFRSSNDLLYIVHYDDCNIVKELRFDYEIEAMARFDKNKLVIAHSSYVHRLDDRSKSKIERDVVIFDYQTEQVVKRQSWCIPDGEKAAQLNEKNTAKHINHIHTVGYISNNYIISMSTCTTIWDLQKSQVTAFNYDFRFYQEVSKRMICVGISSKTNMSLLGPDPEIASLFDLNTMTVKESITIPAGRGGLATAVIKVPLQAKLILCTQENEHSFYVHVYDLKSKKTERIGSPIRPPLVFCSGSLVGRSVQPGFCQYDNSFTIIPFEQRQLSEGKVVELAMLRQQRIKVKLNVPDLSKLNPGDFKYPYRVNKIIKQEELEFTLDAAKALKYIYETTHFRTGLDEIETGRYVQCRNQSTQEIYHFTVTDAWKLVLTLDPFIRSSDMKENAKLLKAAIMQYEQEQNTQAVVKVVTV